MINQETIIKQVSETLPVNQRQRKEHIANSYELGVMDLANKFVTQDRMVMKEVDVAANRRTVIVKGASGDLESIYYIRYGTGESQKLLEYVPFSQFVEKYSNPSATASTPSYWTYFGLDPGTRKPVVKFDVPAETATTMEVYHFKEATSAQIRDICGPALVNITLAFFYGIGSPEGRGYYQAYRISVADVRAQEKRVKDKHGQFVADIPEENIAVVRMNLRDDRL